MPVQDRSRSIVEYHHQSYNQLKQAVAELLTRWPASRAEWEKAKLLAGFEPYTEFVAQLSGTTRHKVSTLLLELAGMTDWHAMLADGLEQIAALSAAGGNPGEIRIHAFTAYCVVRLTRPTIVVETGVCSGKSSAMILLALKSIGRGRLVSVDVGDFSSGRGDERLASPGGSQPGWFVPAALRENWELIIGDAQQVLPTLLPSLAPLDIFIHDSLHTYEHMQFEYNVAQRYLRPGGLLLSDDILHTHAFADTAAIFPGRHAAFGTFGGFLLPENHIPERGTVQS